MRRREPRRDGTERAGRGGRGGRRRASRVLAGFALGAALAAAITLGIRAAGSPGPAEGSPRLAGDASGLSRAIAYMEARYRGQEANHVLAGRLADRYMLRFRAAGRAADARRAEALAGEIVRSAPRPGAGRARLALIRLGDHRFEEAAEAADAARASDPGGAAALGVSFDVAMAVGRYEDARDALAALPGGTLTRRLREARWLAARGRPEAAWRTLDSACDRILRSSLRPEVSAWCLTELAALAHEVEGPDAAGLLYRRALEASPGYTAAVEGLAGIRRLDGDWEGAAALYGTLPLGAHPDLHLRLAEVEEARGRAREARRHERAFLRAVAEPAEARSFALELATHLARTPEGRDEALRLAREEAARRPAVEVLEALAWVRVLRGEHRVALAVLDRAAARLPATPSADFIRGRALRGLGREAAAEDLLRRAGARPGLLHPYLRREAGLEGPGLPAARRSAA